MKKLLINVLIPAYNEEKNIRNVLLDLLAQNRSNFNLQTIFVVLDGCTDETYKMAKTVKSKHIKVINNKKRVGKIQLLNNFLDKYPGGYLIQIDADAKTKNISVISHLVRHLVKGSDLVTGYHEYISPKTYIGKIAAFGVDVWEDAKNSLGRSGERYWVCGQLRGFSDRFAKNFRYEKGIYASEDTYSFYWAKQNGYRYSIEPKAIVYFVLPQTLDDYFKQMNRYLKIKNRMMVMFPSALTTKYETMTFTQKYTALLMHSIRTPYLALPYIMVQLIAKCKSHYYIDKQVWDISTTSKISIT